jgi:hypothetical protein
MKFAFGIAVLWTIYRVVNVEEETVQVYNYIYDNEPFK